MIKKNDDCEYTITIADLMVTLSELDEFIVWIWIGSVEKPLKFTDSDEFTFLQESIKVKKDNHIEYVLYDMITHIQVGF